MTMNAKRTGIVLVCGALALFVLLMIAPKSSTAEQKAGQEEKAKVGISTDANPELYLNMASKSLEPAKKQELDRFVAARKFDSAATFWDRLKRPDLASYYTEVLAKEINTAEAWFKAGNRYYYSVQFSQDKSEEPVLYQSAMRCFNKGLSMEPGNTDAKIMLAACYVEGSQDPMEGIRRLKEVEKTDSSNVKLQWTFAFFSLKSRQYDKAIQRFKKVLAVDSTYIEAYLHLADAYEQLGETEQTIDALERYADRTSDVTARLEIRKYIAQLKK